MQQPMFSLFSGLDAKQVEQVLTSGRRLVIEPGSVFIREGDQGDSLFLILSGSVSVFARSARGVDRELASIDAPAVIGELEAFTGDPRSASVKARDRVEVLELPFAQLRERLEHGDPVMLQVVLQTARVIARRLSAMNRKFTEISETAGGPRRDELREFQQKLLSEWSG